MITWDMTPRFVQKTNLLVDNQWGLNWLVNNVKQFESDRVETSWSKANKYCQSLGARLPDISELVYLVEGGTYLDQHLDSGYDYYVFPSRTKGDYDYWVMDYQIKKPYSNNNYPASGRQQALCVKN